MNKGVLLIIIPQSLGNFKQIFIVERYSISSNRGLGFCSIPENFDHAVL